MWKLHWLACVGLGVTIALTGCSEEEDKPGPPGEGVDPNTVYENHLAAILAQNVAGATKNYAEDARVDVYNQADGSHAPHTDMAAITGFYTALFATGDLSTLVSKHMHFNGSTDDTFASAFMVWECTDCNIAEATETMIFGLDGRILRHTFVYRWTEGQGPESAAVAIGTGLDKPVSLAWANHFSAFGGQNVTNIMKDYDDSSEVYVFDHSSGNLDTHTGTTEIASLFVGLFATLPDASDVSAPVQVVEEKETAPYVLLVWKSPGNGYARATDTFVFNNADTAMIKRQFVVVNYQAPAPSEAANTHLNAVRAQTVTDATMGYVI